MTYPNRAQHFAACREGESTTYVVSSDGHRTPMNFAPCTCADILRWHQEEEAIAAYLAQHPGLMAIAVPAQP